jgi:membrane protease YdiL (CAAX protease family)
MTTQEATRRGLWARLPVTGRAIACGLAIGLSAANVWPLLVLHLGVLAATAGELVFLGLYLMWAAGAFPPARTRAARRAAFRTAWPAARLWIWGLPAALAFAACVHLAIVLLFRFTPFPAAAFHAGYDFSFIPTVRLRLLACVMSALSAGVCEEVGFRGYLQTPIESRHGPAAAIAVSSLLFMLLHLNKDWSVIGMTPIVLGAGVLLGLLAWASRTLAFCMLGHWVMDIGLFAYWWTQTLGVFRARTVFETGLDAAFLATAGALVLALTVTGTCIARLRQATR